MRAQLFYPYYMSGFEFGMLEGPGILIIPYAGESSFQGRKKKKNHIMIWKRTRIAMARGQELWAWADLELYSSSSDS